MVSTVSMKCPLFAYIRAATWSPFKTLENTMMTLINCQVEKLTTLTHYYEVWKPAPTKDSLQFLQQDLVLKIK